MFHFFVTMLISYQLTNRHIVQFKTQYYDVEIQPHMNVCSVTNEHGKKSEKTEGKSNRMRWGKKTE